MFQVIVPSIASIVKFNEGKPLRLLGVEVLRNVNIANLTKRRIKTIINILYINTELRSINKNMDEIFILTSPYLEKTRRSSSARML